ncbi:MAG: SsrA-binding protein SmpB [Thermotogae bacterium]|nr:SsrA-binding protein SmpB [Thermotogota bacterium]
MKRVAMNKKARHNYFIEETVEAGIALKGTEVKSLREGKGNISDGYCEVRNGEIYLVNVHISPYKHEGYVSHNPLRDRKLLLHRREIKKLAGRVTMRGYTLIPLEIYFNDKNIAKVKLALAKGKNVIDKRETIKRREVEKEIERRLKYK